MGFLRTFIELLFQALSLLIIGRVLISWIDPMGNMRVTQLLHELTEPILGPIRSVVPSLGMIDLSPLVALLLLQVTQALVLSAI